MFYENDCFITENVNVRHLLKEKIITESFHNKAVTQHAHSKVVIGKFCFIDRKTREKKKYMKRGTPFKNTFSTWKSNSVYILYIPKSQFLIKNKLIKVVEKTMIFDFCDDDFFYHYLIFDDAYLFIQ